MKKQKAVDVGFESFNIVKKSEAGVKMPLYLPDGKKTTSWLKLRGVNSPSFEEAVSVADREQVELLGKESKLEQNEIDNARREITRKMLAALVVDWSDKKTPCTEKNVCEFFKGAPQIQRQVDTFATEDKHFINDSFSKPPTS
tara:strand:- start:20659 stop:21087 length:429 start_codon:yes stop_codon:yes gene_type:complete